ncbi:MAG: hypothetical protein JSR45_15105 [Proteobacteria bacterium]|nr:hypothetical protein [Pseudomonadota bacterium]
MSTGVEILVPLGFFGMIAGVVLVPRYFRNKERTEMQQTIRAAIEKGQPLPPEVLDAMTRDVKPAPSAARDIRVGVVWLAIGLGIAGFGLAMGQYTEAAMPPFLGIGAIPAAVGLAFIVMSFFNNKSR